MASIKFSLRFIRKGASSNTDDTVTIIRVNNDKFKLTYTYGDTKFKMPREMILTDRGVFQWMRSTMRLLENDADPFELVQVDTPFMPSVVINATRLRDSYHDILDVLEFHLDNWPIEHAYSYKDDEDEDEDEYADMPPLIDANLTPIRQNTVRGRHHLFLDENV